MRCIWAKLFLPFWTTAIILAISHGADDKVVQYRKGDIIIGGLAVVHNYGKMVGGTQLIEIINMMVEQINRNTTILPGIDLGSLIIDTRRTGSYTLKQITRSFFPLIAKETQNCNNDSMFTPLPLFAGVIGSSTSGVSMDSAKLLQAFSIPQISYWSTSSDLSDKTKFPYFFRTIPSDAEQTDAIIEFAAIMKWNYVSFIYEDSAYGISGYEAFVKYAAKRGICVAAGIRMSKVPSSSEIQSALQSLKEKRRARAVVLYVLSGVVKLLMTEAKLDKDTAGHFRWLVTDTTVGILPGKTDDYAAYKSELQNSIGFAPSSTFLPDVEKYFFNLSISDRSNSTLNPWFAKYVSVINNCSLSTTSAETSLRRCSNDEKIDPSKYKQYIRTENVVNAFLMYTYALDQVHKEVCQGEAGICSKLKAMTGSSSLANLTYHALQKLTIIGVNGLPLKFDENQDPPHYYSIYIYDETSTQGSMFKWKKAGQLSGRVIDMNMNSPFALRSVISTCADECDSDEIKTISDASSCCWTCTKCEQNQYISNSSQCVNCPSNYRPTKELDRCEMKQVRYFNLDNPYATVPFTIGLIGAIIALTVVLIFVKFNDSPIVKASGKELCFISLFGIFLACMNCFALMGESTVASCVISCLIIATGPTIMHAALLVKTIRVVIIFRSTVLSHRMKHFILPKCLMLITAVIVLPQIIVIITWLAASRTGWEHVDDADNTFVLLTCSYLITPHVVICFVYPFILTIACTVLATINRHVPTGFKETKLVGFAVYTTIVVWLAFAVTFGANQSGADIKISIVSLCVTLNAYAVLFSLFLPRCYSMVCSPEENTREAVMESHGKENKLSSGLAEHSRDASTAKASHKSTTSNH